MAFLWSFSNLATIEEWKILQTNQGQENSKDNLTNYLNMTFVDGR